MASRKEYEMLFQLNAKLGGSYNTVFKNAQGAVASMQDKITALNKVQSDISAYTRQQNAIEASRKKLEVLQQQYDNIQKEINETSSFSSTLENRLLSKQQQIDKTTISLNNQIYKLDSLGEKLRQAGIDTSDLTAESTKLSKQMEELKEKQEEAAEGARRFSATASAAFSAVGSAVIAAGIAKGLEEITEWYGEAINASMIFESAMTGIAKTTDMSDKELAIMAEEIKDISTNIPIVTEELAGIGEVAGQLGIAKENLLDFSEVMAMLSTATTMTAEEGATMLAQFANITQMNPRYYSNLASAVVELGNNYATTEQKIIDMSQGIAASASLAKMSEADMLGLSAAVTSLGIETQAGATSMSKLITELLMAVETGDNLKEFASIAGMTADEFKYAWGENAVLALQAFVVGLNDTERTGKSATVALTELGITEARMQRMILSLANSGDLLNRTLATSAQGWSQNSALVNEANKRYATQQSRLTMLQNAYNNVKIAVGDEFNPELTNLYQIGTKVLKGVEEFIQKNPALVKGITAFVGVIGLAISGLTAYVAISKIAAVASAALTAAIPGLNVILAVVGGVALLTGGVMALAEATRKEKDEVLELTAVSREQHYQLEDLNKEYQKAVELYGETSYEAQSLQWQIEKLNKEYESGLQTIEEYISNHEELMRDYNDMNSLHSDAYKELDKEQRSTVSLIAKLEELTATTESASKNKQAILSIIEALNEQVPNLALSYDKLTGSSEDVVEYLYSIAEAEAAQKLLAQQWEEYVDRVGQENILKSAKDTAEENARIAQEEYDRAFKALREAQQSIGQNINLDKPSLLVKIFAKEEISNYENARSQLEKYNKALDDATKAYEENTKRTKELEKEFEIFQNAQENVIDTTEDMTEVISTIKNEVDKLRDAYNEVYESAVESIQGQFELWDIVAEEVAISVDTITDALSSQTEYWSNYNTNLANLAARSKDIEGLKDMLISFADGSSDSVRAVAGMAEATDEELLQMVRNWKRLQIEQGNAAKLLADIETGYTDSLKSMQNSFAETVESMDFSDQAIETGQRVVQGYINGALRMLPLVKNVHERIAQAGIDAIDARMEIQSPSRVMYNRAEMAWAGYIKATEAMEPEVKMAMAETAGSGVNAIATEALSNTNVSNGPIHLSVAPTFNIPAGSNTSDLLEILRDASDELRAMVLEILEDAGVDSTRRAFA